MLTPIQASGYPGTPGIFSDSQIKGWKKVTDAVHAKGGAIFCQIWHTGRASPASFRGGAQPWSSSDLPMNGNYFDGTSCAEFPPRPMTVEEIQELVKEFGAAAKRAVEAGFDGVEIHGANGYLLDQFLQDKTNQRTDNYGGTIENRARLMLEVTDACIDVWGADRVGMHLAPRRDSHDMGDSDPAATFGYVTRELGKRKIAFICAREAVGEDSLGPLLKKEFGGVYIANESLDKQSAQKLLDAGTADAVAFGKAFISNPDLPRRLQTEAPLNEWKPETFYGKDDVGYTDYPALA